MKTSTLVKNQVKTFRGEFTDASGPHLVIAEARHDDRCGNGHNTFSITGHVYGKRGDRRDGKAYLADGSAVYSESCGCVHEDIARAIPALAPFIKWHLVSTDGPMHYGANAVYLAGDRDCWGLRKGERKPLVSRSTGEPITTWIQKDTGEESYSLPSSDKYTLGDEIAFVCVQAHRVGEGKERDLDGARRCAVWPDATDAELMQEPDALREALAARLPALMADFQRAVESLGFAY